MGAILTPANGVRRRGRHASRLLARLEGNACVLIDVRHLLTEAVTAEHRIAPGGEWLLDNFYLIEGQFKGYSQELPSLLNGALASFSRVYAIALEIIAHGDGRTNAENLRGLVAAYQSKRVLTVAEL